MAVSVEYFGRLAGSERRAEKFKITASNITLPWRVRILKLGALAHDREL